MIQHLKIECAPLVSVFFLYITLSFCLIIVLKEAIKNKLMVFERKVLRRIFGPTKEGDGTWRIKTNDELDVLIRYKNILNHIKLKD